MIHRRKGATLAEICVVLAVVSIIALVVVSFVSMISSRSAASAAKLKAMEDIELVESLVDNWFAAMVKDGGKVEQNGVLMDNVIVITDDATSIKGDADDSRIWMEDLSKLKIRLPGEEKETVYALKTIKGLAFSSETREDVDGNVVDTLYFCKVEYTYSANGREITQYYTFCVNPIVGEVIAPSEV